MFSFVKNTSIWLQTPVMMKDNNEESFNLMIVLEKASLANAHLVITDNINPRFCLPVSILIDVNYSEDELELTFHEFNEMKLVFIPKHRKDIETFVSQFSLCSTISKQITDDFVEENTEFIKQYAKTDSIFPDSREKPNPSVLLPIDDKTTFNTWKRRNTHMNFSYISQLEDFQMCFITYNVAQQEPSEEIVPSICSIFKGSHIDAIFITLQEIDFGAKAVVVGSSDTKDSWSAIFRKVIRKISIDYALIKSDSLGGVYSAIFVKPDLTTHFSVKQPIEVRLGVAGLMANKSALIFPIFIGETSINVIAVHLAPHAGNNNTRIQQVEQILKTMPPADYSVMLGDLNFRILLTYEDALKYINENNIDKVRETDELLAAMNFTDVMKGFSEPLIKFLPTYKFDKHADTYDTSQKKRVPAYTDRIIIKTEQPRVAVGPSDTLVFESDVIRSQVEGFDFQTKDYFSLIEPKPNYPIKPECLVYDCLQTNYSDHRPVYAIYNFKIPIIIPEKSKTLDELMLKKKEDALLLSKPKVIVEVLDGKIVLSNKGACWVKWAITASSTKLSQERGILFPKESIEIESTITGSDPNVTFIIEGADPINVTPKK